MFQCSLPVIGTAGTSPFPTSALILIRIHVENQPDSLENTSQAGLSPAIPRCTWHESFLHQNQRYFYERQPVLGKLLGALKVSQHLQRLILPKVARNHHKRSWNKESAPTYNLSDEGKKENQVPVHCWSVTTHPQVCKPCWCPPGSQQRRSAWRGWFPSSRLCNRLRRSCGRSAR